MEEERFEVDVTRDYTEQCLNYGIDRCPSTELGECLGSLCELLELSCLENYAILY